MKKETIKTATTVVAGFGLALLVVGTSPSFQACMYEHQNHAGGAHLQEHVSRLLTFYKIGRGCGGEWLHKHGEAVIALFTVILGIATWLLWRATKKLVEGADKTSERQLRAYVCLDGGSLRFVTDSEGKSIINKDRNAYIEGFASLKNFGQTPAYEARAWVRIDLCERDKPPFDQKSVGLGRSLIGPGSQFNLPVHKEVTNTDVTDIRNEKKFLFVWGRADYVDIFGRERFFEFYQMNGKEIPGRGWPLNTSDKPQYGN